MVAVGEHLDDVSDEFDEVNLVELIRDHLIEVDLLKFIKLKLPE